MHRAASVARAIYQDAAHHTRRHGEKVRAVLPIEAVYIDQTKVGIVHQRGGLNGMIGPFATQAAVGDLPQLRVGSLDQTAQSVFVSASPCAEEVCHLVSAGSGEVSAMCCLGWGAIRVVRRDSRMHLSNYINLLTSLETLSPSLHSDSNRVWRCIWRR